MNIKLFASATETTQNTVNINPNSPEIPDTFSATKNSLETVRIKANVEGFASKITKRIQLSSQPKRSQQQIVTLLGGTFLNTLGTGETTLGLANLAGKGKALEMITTAGMLTANEAKEYFTNLTDNKLEYTFDKSKKSDDYINMELAFSESKKTNTDKSPKRRL